MAFLQLATPILQFVTIAFEGTHPKGMFAVYNSTKQYDYDFFIC
jgi:hypothetical protein